MFKWILTSGIGALALVYIGTASYYDVGSLRAVAAIGLFIAAFGMALALSFMERPAGRKTREIFSRKFKLGSKRL